MSAPAQTDPVRASDPISGSCTAHTRLGNACKYPRVPGATVCRFDGGNAPQVLGKARLRLLMASDPVAAAMVQIALDKKQPGSVRVSAGNSVLDRAGLKADADLVQARLQAIQAT